MSLAVKICGLSTPESVATALEAGADMIGFVFHPRSPRAVTPQQAAALATPVRGRVPTVALVVDADDAALDAIVGTLVPDWLQCHGRETAERVAEIRARHNLPVMKAIGVAGAEDLATAARWAGACDRVLLDARPPPDAAYPGGHGRPFDWRLLATLDPALPFMLSGGLDPANVGAAVAGARAAGKRLLGVDVSSGVESAPGIKDEARIRAFLAAARAAQHDEGPSP